MALLSQIPAEGDLAVQRNEIDAALVDVPRADIFDVGVLGFLRRLGVLLLCGRRRSKHR